MAEEFEKQFTCLGENTEKYISFTVPIKKKVTRSDKDVEEISRNISYVLQFIGSTRFMASSLSNLVNKVSKGLHRIKVKLEIMIKNVKLVGLNISIATVFLHTQILKMI